MVDVRQKEMLASNLATGHPAIGRLALPPRRHEENGAGGGVNSPGR